MSADNKFTGHLPMIYDRYVSMKFEPYALDLAERIEKLQPRLILETACGTGVVTRALLIRLPEAQVVATDLNQAMLDVAAAQIDNQRATFRRADAMSLPFEDGRFDAVVSQFGVMFFPDRMTAYREAFRTLRAGGRFVFNTWDQLLHNPVTQIVVAAMAELFPADPPQFFKRVPFGYHDMNVVRDELRRAGFLLVEIARVEKRSRAASAQEAAIALCQGTPLRLEIEERAPGGLVEATKFAARALEREFGSGAIDASMAAYVVQASRAA